MAKKKAATKPPKKTEKSPKSESKPDSSASAEGKDTTKDSSASAEDKATTKDSSAEPKSYNLGERQKPVTKAYRASWDRIFGKGARGS